MTPIEVAAWLASVVLLKASAVVIALLIISKRDVGLRAWGAGAWGLAAIVILGGLLPTLGDGLVSVPHRSLQFAGVIVVVWAGGVGVHAVRFIRGLVAAQGLAARSTRATWLPRSLLQRAARAVGCRRLPEVRETSELATAALIGFWQPVLLIPSQARHWSDEGLFGVLCHELEHARQNDWLLMCFERIVAAVFWINPLVHVMTRQAAASRERSADEAALRAGAAAPDYAHRLIAVARELQHARGMAVTVAFASGGVEARVKALFMPRPPTPSPAFDVRAACIALPIVVLLATAQPFLCLPT